MTAQKGKDLLLKVDTDGAGSFTTVAGLRARTLAFNAAPVDITDQESAGRWRELLEGAGIKTARITGSGIFKDAASDERRRRSPRATISASWPAATSNSRPAGRSSTTCRISAASPMCRATTSCSPWRAARTRTTAKAASAEPGSSRHFSAGSGNLRISAADSGYLAASSSASPSSTSSDGTSPGHSVLAPRNQRLLPVMRAV